MWKFCPILSTMHKFWPNNRLRRQLGGWLWRVGLSSEGGALLATELATITLALEIWKPKKSRGLVLYYKAWRLSGLMPSAGVYYGVRPCHCWYHATWHRKMRTHLCTKRYNCIWCFGPASLLAPCQCYWEQNTGTRNSFALSWCFVLYFKHKVAQYRRSDMIFVKMFTLADFGPIIFYP